ncbi:MAG: ABC transporter ATP-binding protein [Clostridiales bacterium]|nr:ABC transporter ATP-binding protein [Clostridiales bacterium]
MIAVKNITKRFDKKAALENISCTIPDGRIYGLVGSNGAGKSTLLRLLTGIYKPDSGEIGYDGLAVYEAPEVKEQIVFISDDLYFLPQSNMERMAKLYAVCYKGFDNEYFRELAAKFRLDPRASIGTFSKGMKRQAAMILALACRTKYIFLDETLDGLDPMMRSFVKTVVRGEMTSRGATAVITSHSLRELEDTCDQLAMLHDGGIVFESDIKNLKTTFFKIQVSFGYDYDASLFRDINVRSFTKVGSVANLVVGGDREQIQAMIKNLNPLLMEVLPLSLEEVFVHEMSAHGYALDVSILAQEEGGHENVQ